MATITVDPSGVARLPNLPAVVNPSQFDANDPAFRRVVEMLRSRATAAGAGVSAAPSAAAPAAPAPVAGAPAAAGLGARVSNLLGKVGAVGNLFGGAMDAASAAQGGSAAKVGADVTGAITNTAAGVGALVNPALAAPAVGYGVARALGVDDMIGKVWSSMFGPGEYNPQIFKPEVAQAARKSGIPATDPAIIPVMKDAMLKLPQPGGAKQDPMQTPGEGLGVPSPSAPAAPTVAPRPAVNPAALEDAGVPLLPGQGVFQRSGGPVRTIDTGGYGAVPSAAPAAALPRPQTGNAGFDNFLSGVLSTGLSIGKEKQAQRASIAAANNATAMQKANMDLYGNLLKILSDQQIAGMKENKPVVTAGKDPLDGKVSDIVVTDPRTGTSMRKPILTPLPPGETNDSMMARFRKLHSERPDQREEINKRMATYGLPPL